MFLYKHGHAPKMKPKDNSIVQKRIQQVSKVSSHQQTFRGGQTWRSVWMLHLILLSHQLESAQQHSLLM